MKAKLLLRIAAILMLMHNIGHTMGALTWKEAPNQQIGGVITAMQNNYFDFMGSRVSYGLFFQGYGISMIFVLLMVSVLLWLLSVNYQFAMVLVLTCFLFAFGISELFYFFPLAASFSLLAGLSAGATLFQKKVV